MAAGVLSGQHSSMFSLEIPCVPKVCVCLPYSVPALGAKGATYGSGCLLLPPWSPCVRCSHQSMITPMVDYNLKQPELLVNYRSEVGIVAALQHTQGPLGTKVVTLQKEG